MFATNECMKSTTNYIYIGLKIEVSKEFFGFLAQLHLLPFAWQVSRQSSVEKCGVSVVGLIYASLLFGLADWKEEERQRILETRRALHDKYRNKFIDLKVSRT